MSRQARALPSSALDDTSVSTGLAGPASLAARWRALFGCDAPTAAGFIEQAITWREQVDAHGDVAPAIARDLAIAARQAGEARVPAAPRTVSTSQAEPDAAPCNIPATAPTPVATPSPAAPRTRSRGSRAAPRATPAPLPPASSQLVPGARLVKAHGGRNHVVEVTATGFVYEGESFSSLSAIAKHITGTHWNGLLFFGLRRRKTYPAKVAGHG